MNKMNYFLLSITLIAGAFGAQAQTRYVSMTGSDAANNCDLPGSPCATVAHAVSVATTNDSILVAAGSYTFPDVVNINLDGIVVTAMDPANKPEIVAGDPDVISVTAPNVTISNMIFKMGLLLNGKRGIVATGNFDNITIIGNEFISTTQTGIWSPDGVVFGSYAILLNASIGTPAMATVQDNVIGPLTPDYANFGRGLGLGLNSGPSMTPHGDFSGNDITAYYPIQALFIKGDLTFENNILKGLCMFNAPNVGSTVLLDNNTFDAVNDPIASYLYALLDIRAYGNGTITVSNNEFINYAKLGLLSMASRNVEVLNNTFSPSATATDFASILVNTKLMTTGIQSNTYSDGITIKGNMFNAGAINEGIAVMFSDHYGANTPAFDVTVIGGPTAGEKNTFATELKHYIVLDSIQGSSNAVPLWTIPTATPETIMLPVSQSINAWVVHNNYSLYTVAEIEGRNVDTLDSELLGKVILGDVSSVSLSELSANDFEIYPNPSDGELFISLKGDEGAIELSLIDLSGRTLINIELPTVASDFNYSLDCSKIPAGNYFLTLKTVAGSSTQRFVKK